jgi:hypothetical protein
MVIDDHEICFLGSTTGFDNMAIRVLRTLLPEAAVDR